MVPYHLLVRLRGAQRKQVDGPEVKAAVRAIDEAMKRSKSCAGKYGKAIQMRRDGETVNTLDLGSSGSNALRVRLPLPAQDNIGERTHMDELLRIQRLMKWGHE